MSSAQQKLPLVQRFQRLMATPMGIHVAVLAGQEEHAEDAIARCFAWFAEVGARLTRFADESELSRLNAASGEWQAVSPLLFEVVEESIAAAEATDGLFDPALLSVLEALGYAHDFNEIAYRDVGMTGAAALPSAGGQWRAIERDRARRRIRLPAGARLDLGGIVKGWVADRGLERYFAGFANVLIDAGGDIRARGGPRPEEAWPIGVGEARTAPQQEEETTASGVVLTLGRGGLATSGATSRWWYRAGERLHHLIDPRTGRPAALWVDATDDTAGERLIASATALAPTAAHAEVAAKVALLRGYPQALVPVEQAWEARDDKTRNSGADEPVHRAYGDAGVALILILGTGEVVCSANLHAYLATLGGGGAIWLE